MKRTDFVHRGSLRSIATSNGRSVFVRCDCGWRSRVTHADDVAWGEHREHAERHADNDDWPRQ